MKTPKQAYIDLTQTLRKDHEKLIRKVQWLAWSRLILFLMLVIAGVLVFRLQPELVLIVILVGIPLFILLVRYHLRNEARSERLGMRININEQEIKALNGDFSGFDPGDCYIDQQHVFTSDLDVFGSHGIFQFLSRTSLAGGADSLASMLKSPLIKNREILKRQKAIQELSKLGEWRDSFRVSGMMAERKWSLSEKNNEWINLRIISSGKAFRLYSIAAGVISIPLTMLAILEYLPWVWVLAYTFYPFMMISAKAGKIREAHSQISRRGKQLREYSDAISLVDQASFESEILQDIQSELNNKDGSAADAFNHLARITDAMDTRLNPFMSFILNYFFLWDLWQVQRFESWKIRWSEQLKQWFKALSEMDALSSLSTFHNNYPDYPFPEVIDEEGIMIRAEDAGHPLIPADRRVGNPIDIGGKHEFTVITGANMAGKSTYLRTVGVNLLLAMIGCPVCAKGFAFIPVKLHTGILTLDSLAKNESFFYAELLRLKSILDRLKNGEVLFILLDEILKGTNTHDKQEGSKELLKVMAGYSVSGMIATHDVQLGHVQPGQQAMIKNVCFEARIDGDEVYYDYQLREGIASSMTAATLMRKLGIINQPPA